MLLSNNIDQVWYEMSDSENGIEPTSKRNKVYKTILQEIRDMKVLSNYQLYYLRTSQISRSNLLEIIELYNFVTRNINDALYSHELSSLNIPPEGFPTTLVRWIPKNDRNVV